MQVQITGRTFRMFTSSGPVQVQSKLVQRTVPGNLVFIGEILGGGKDFKPKMDELVR